MVDKRTPDGSVTSIADRTDIVCMGAMRVPSTACHHPHVAHTDREAVSTAAGLLAFRNVAHGRSPQHKF